MQPDKLLLQSSVSPTRPMLFQSLALLSALSEIDDLWLHFKYKKIYLVISVNIVLIKLIVYYNKS